MSSTLQRLENLEKTVGQIKGAVDMSAALSTKLPQLEQSVAALSRTLKELIEQSNNVLNYQRQKIEIASTQNVALEQSVLVLGQIITAISKELSDNHGLSNENVLAHRQRIVDNIEKGKILDSLKNQAIKPSEVVNENSIVVVTETVKAKADSPEAKDKQVSGYRILELHYEGKESKLVSDFVGKKAGDTVEVVIEGDQGGTVLLAIQEVYDYVQQIKGQGEEVSQNSDDQSAKEVSGTSQEAQEVSNETPANT